MWPRVQPPVGRSPYLPEGNASRYRSAPVRRIPLPEAPSQDPCLTAALLVCTWPCCRLLWPEAFLRPPLSVSSNVLLGYVLLGYVGLRPSWSSPRAAAPNRASVIRVEVMWGAEEFIELRILKHCGCFGEKGSFVFSDRFREFLTIEERPIGEDVLSHLRGVWVWVGESRSRRESSIRWRRAGDKQKTSSRRQGAQRNHCVM